MESLCKIRDVYRSIAEFEVEFMKQHNLCLNEGMLLCSLSKADKSTSGEIAAMLGLTTSNTSKVIKSVEKKGYIVRVLGEADKRQMYFSLTKEGRERLDKISCDNIKIPAILENLI